jgi:hypothetical protein
LHLLPELVKLGLIQVCLKNVEVAASLGRVAGFFYSEGGSRLDVLERGIFPAEGLVGVSNLPGFSKSSSPG